MNFLAHIYLSGDSQKLMIGNFIGDFVKGSQINSFDDEIIRGIKTHRLIDSFTDTHKIVKKSKSKLRNRYRHYSGVIVDMYYDHFLAANWNLYHSNPLEVFVADTYKTLLEHEDILPARVNYMLTFMVPQNWLLNYRNLDGVAKALSGLSRRTKFDSGMEYAIEDLKEHYSIFEEEFKIFFNDLRDYVNELNQ